MALKPEQLGAQLKQGLAPIYVVGGDEPLLVQEAADRIRAAARAAGAEDREVFHVEANFDWGALLASAGSMSLFASRRLLELRMPAAKPGKEGGAALERYAAHPPGDVTLLVILDKLEREVQKAKWFQALEGAGVVVQVWPVGTAQLPGWIAHRARELGLQLSPDAVGLLAERVEGNLLAAAQELDKLALLLGEGGGGVDAEQVAAAVADSARFDPFGLVDCLLEGNAARAVRMVNGLRAEGEDALHLLGTLSWALHGLYEIAQELAGGKRLDAALERRYAWKRRRNLIQQGLRRLNVARLRGLIRTCARIDRVCKGQQEGRPWDELLRLSLAIAGARVV